MQVLFIMQRKGESLMAKSNFIVRGGADFSGIQNEMAKTEKSLKGFEGRINGMFKGLGINLGALTKVGLIAAATKKVVDFGKAAIDVAADVVEVQNVVDTTFGAMSKDVDEFAKNSIKAFGLSSLAAKHHASTMGAMLKSSGIQGQMVRDMSLDLTGLAADMASFYNLDNDVAFQKIMSGMSGMTQPLKELGINMNIANIEAFAMANGVNKAWREMNQAEQTIWRYNYLMNVTKDSQGDFAKEIGTWSNQVKIMKMQWQEFSGLMGQVLIKVFLPVVKVINKILEGLIKVTKEIGKIYTMITGKEIAVETNNNIADSAFDAAEGEDKIADGIGKATKAAKKALAPFDELNILQNGLGGGGTGGLAGAISDGGLNTTIKTNQADEGLKIKIDDEEPKKFFIWFSDKWNGLKQMLAVPIMVPAPIFGAIPNPIYEPEWNLTPPLIPSPVFAPLRNPVYEPNWNLETPKVMEPYFPPILNPVYEPNWNLDYPVLKPLIIPALGLKQWDLSLENMQRTFVTSKTKLEGLQAELSKKISEETSKVSKQIESGLTTTWGTIESNYNKHKENVGAIATGISAVLVANINQGLSTVGTNVNNTITTVQENLNTFGRNVGSIASETAKSWANNISEGLKTTGQNIATFANSAGQNLKDFGRGALSIVAEVARGIANNMASGLQTAWQSFKDFASATGERVSGWFSANKKVVTTTAIAAGVVVGAGALALAAPALIPYAGAALGGLASIPALAKGGITNGPTLAMVGDNVGGKEVVSPLDGLLDMIKEATAESGGNSGDLHLTIKIGEDTITDKVVENINRKSRISGKTIVEV